MLKKFIILCLVLGVFIISPYISYSQENADNEQLLDKYLSSKPEFTGIKWQSVCDKPENKNLCTEFNNELHKISASKVIINDFSFLYLKIDMVILHFGQKYMETIMPEYKEYIERQKNWKGFPGLYYDLVLEEKIKPEFYLNTLEAYNNSRIEGKSTIEAYGLLFLNSSEGIEKLRDDLKKKHPMYNDSDIDHLMMCYVEGYYEDKVVMNNLNETLGKLVYYSENMVEIYTRQLLDLSKKAKELQLGGLTTETFTLQYNETKVYETSDVLAEGVTYIVTASGKASCWSNHTDGVDACYCYGEWRCPTREYWGIIRLNDKSLKDWDPKIEYTESHIYTIKIVGFGQKLKVSAFDGGGYDDNNGSFEVTITKE